VLLVGLQEGNPSVGEYEQLLLSMKTTARKELVLLNSNRSCPPGSTAGWLKSRLWIHAHHHIQMALPSTDLSLELQPKQLTIGNLGRHFSRLYNSQSSQRSSPNSPYIYTGHRSDFSRLARRLLSKSIGLVLGGGGARGLSHIGVIRALEEAGIPIDMVGGTSMGAFVGGLYARDNDHVSVTGRAKILTTALSATWRTIMDLTYPYASMTTGGEFNRAIWKVFGDLQIEDCWLPYYAVTTNITLSREEVHQQGYIWRFIRASMSLSGYLPPICYNDCMLMDGGYLNNVPADIMHNMGASTILALDVSGSWSTLPVTYGDSLSGWWVLLNRFNPFGKNYGDIPPLSEIQSRLAYASSVTKLEEVMKIDGVHYLAPPVQCYGLMDFGKFTEIEQVGYDFMKKMIAKWNEDGILWDQFGVRLDNCSGLGNRRASI
jgi:lysophospholipid hydrolase